MPYNILRNRSAAIAVCTTVYDVGDSKVHGTWRIGSHMFIMLEFHGTDTDKDTDTDIMDAPIV